MAPQAPRGMLRHNVIAQAHASTTIHSTARPLALATSVSVQVENNSQNARIHVISMPVLTNNNFNSQYKRGYVVSGPSGISRASFSRSCNLHGDKLLHKKAKYCIILLTIILYIQSVLHIPFCITRMIIIRSVQLVRRINMYYSINVEISGCNWFRRLLKGDVMCPGSSNRHSGCRVI